MTNADTVEKWVIGKFFYYNTGKIIVLNTEIEEAAGNFNPKNSEDADLTVHRHHLHLQKVTDPEIEGTYL